MLFTASGFVLDAKPGTLSEQGQAIQDAFAADAGHAKRPSGRLIADADLRSLFGVL